MSCDIERIQSASALRAWEEGRAKNFVAWQLSVESLTTGLRTTVGLGVMQQEHTEGFLRRRSAADYAYAQGLLAAQASALPPPTQPSSAGSKVKASSEPTQPKAAGPSQTPSDAPAPSVLHNPLIHAISEIHKRMSAAREAFANHLMEGIVASGLGQTTADFEKNSSALLQALDTGLSECVQAHSLAAEAMTVYHRSSIEGIRDDPPVDAWLFEHRYRRCVEALRERQHSFNAQLCSAVEEVWKLEEWREEMTRKMLGSFCQKLHQVETAVQSLSNDAIRALAGHKKEESPSAAILADLQQLLQSAPPPPARPAPQSAQPPQTQQPQAPQRQAPAATANVRAKPGEWPILLRLRDQGHLGPLPPSVLSVLRGPLQAPRRWYQGTQLSMIVLTKDFYLHCFHIMLDKVGSSGTVKVPKAVLAAKAASACAGADGYALDAVEAEPSWSLYLPGAKINLGSGKSRSIEVEEVKRGFLGIKSTTRQSLQADDDLTQQRWLAALQQASQKKLGGYEAQPVEQRKPPPPPPPLPRPGIHGVSDSASAGAPTRQPEVAASQPWWTKPAEAQGERDPIDVQPPTTLAALLKPLDTQESVFGS